MKKNGAITVFVILLLPIAIFLFLRIFGRNEFHVPLIHQEKVEAPGECAFEYTAPYVVHDSVTNRLFEGSDAPLVLVNFSGSAAVQNVVYNELTQQEVRTVDARDLPQVPVPYKTCVFLIPENMDLVVVDRERRIRGYYNASEKKDVDRLMVELNILLKKY